MAHIIIGPVYASLKIRFRTPTVCGIYVTTEDRRGVWITSCFYDSPEPMWQRGRARRKDPASSKKEKKRAGVSRGDCWERERERRREVWRRWRHLSSIIMHILDISAKKLSLICSIYIFFSSSANATLCNINSLLHFNFITLKGVVPIKYIANYNGTLKWSESGIKFNFRFQIKFSKWKEEAWILVRGEW